MCLYHLYQYSHKWLPKPWPIFCRVRVDVPRSVEVALVLFVKIFSSPQWYALDSGRSGAGYLNWIAVSCNICREDRASQTHPGKILRNCRNEAWTCHTDACAIYYIISYHIISYHIISYHIISYHIISYHIISYHIISYHIISYHIISYHIISYHIISYHIISYHIISYHIISYHIISYHIISYHIILYYIILYYIILYQKYLKHYDNVTSMIH